MRGAYLLQKKQSSLLPQQGAYTWLAVYTAAAAVVVARVSQPRVCGILQSCHRLACVGCVVPPLSLLSVSCVSLVRKYNAQRWCCVLPHACVLCVLVATQVQVHDHAVHCRCCSCCARCPVCICVAALHLTCVPPPPTQTVLYHLVS